MYRVIIIHNVYINGITKNIAFLTLFLMIPTHSPLLLVLISNQLNIVTLYFFVYLAMKKISEDIFFYLLFWFSVTPTHSRSYGYFQLELLVDEDPTHMNIE